MEELSHALNLLQLIDFSYSFAALGFNRIQRFKEISIAVPKEHLLDIFKRDMILNARFVNGINWSRKLLIEAHLDLK